MKSLRLMRMAAAATLGIGLGGATIGCRSAVSTHVIPDSECGGWTTKKLRGVPVTVKVPTHLEVRVIEERYLEKGTENEIARVKVVEHEMREGKARLRACATIGIAKDVPRSAAD